MTSELWSTPPEFAAGQYFSATMHGNALVNCAEVLMGVYKGPQCLWQTGFAGNDGDDDADDWNWGYGHTGSGYYRIWSGAVRHKTSADTLAYSVRVWKTAAAQTVRVKAGTSLSDSNVVAAGSGYVDVTDSIDVSGMTADTFYEVFVDVHPASGGIKAQALYIYETDAKSYPTLAAFTAGSTPTAAHWQALSDRASDLWQQLTEPTLPLFGAYHTHQVETLGEQKLGRWMMRYNNRYLAYQIRVRAPRNNGKITYYFELMADNVPMARAGWYSFLHEYAPGVQVIAFKNNTGLAEGTSLRMYGGSELVKLGTPNVDGSFADCVRGYNETPQQTLKNDCYVWQEFQDGETYEKQADYAVYRGVVDLNTLGLNEGQLYEVTIIPGRHEHFNPGDTDRTDMSAFGVDYLYTTSASQPYVPGWSAMPSYSRGSTVTGAASIKTIRDNLTWLSNTARIVYRNHASPFLGRWGGYGVRQRRWLVYYCTDKDQSPELMYWTNNKELETVGLTNKPYEWVSYDLSAAEGLWDGVGYHVRGVTYAMEDDSSV